MELQIIVGGRMTPISQASDDQLQDALEKQELTQEVKTAIQTELSNRRGN